MRKYLLQVAIILFAPILSFNATGAEDSRVSIVGKTATLHRITKVKISIGGKVSHIILPGKGAIANTFEMDVQKWANSDILSFVLDSRGQIPSLAYFQYNGNEFCYLGCFSKLIMDEANNLVVESLHSSASEQVINRYKLNRCALSLHDQLTDTAILSLETEDGQVRRVVTKNKGPDARRFKCEYLVDHGMTRDPYNCFRP